MAAEVYPKLPDDVPKARWQTWPRRAEVHLLFNVRKRMVTNRCAAGTFTCYSCPDESIRIPIEQIEAAFGQRQETVAAGSAPEAKARSASQRISDAELELDDPVVGMFRECRIMLKEEREHSRAQIASLNQSMLEQLKLLTTPVAKSVELLQQTAEGLASRVKFLEERQDHVMKEREEMADFRHVRDLEITRQAAADQRRSEMLGALKKEWPNIVRAWSSGTLRGFVQGVDPNLVDLLIKSELLSPLQVSQLQTLLRDLEREAKAKSNGAATPEAPIEEQPS